MAISSCDVVCVQYTDVIEGCTPLPRYSVHQAPAIHCIHNLQVQVCSRPHNISGFELLGDSCKVRIRRSLPTGHFRVPAAMSLCNNSCGSICIDSLLTLTADVLSVTAWSFS